MGKTSKWNVWSLDTSTGRGMVVDEGSEKEARAAAERRIQSAKRLNMANAWFVALPAGRKPSDEDWPV